MNTVATVDIESLYRALLPPERAFVYMTDYFRRRNINPTQAAKKLNVNPSTVKRFLDGGSLSTSMASKLYTVFKIDPEILFGLEAKANAYKAFQLSK